MHRFTAFYATTLGCAALVALGAPGCIAFDGLDAEAEFGSDSDGRSIGDDDAPEDVGYIDIYQTIAVGAFSIDLGTAYFGFENDGGSERYLEVEFTAHNLRSRAENPFASLSNDGLLFDLNGTYSYGYVVVDSIPGLKSGVGTLKWRFDGGDDVRDAVLSFGDADQVQVVVPLGHPEDTIGLAATAIDPPAAVKDYAEATFDFQRAEIRYSSYGFNDLAPAGHAYLSLEGLLIAEPDIGYGHHWGDENVSLTRPDGISVVPDSFNELLDHGDRLDIRMDFLISEPVAGTYVLTFSRNGLAPVTRTIVVP